MRAEFTCPACKATVLAPPSLAGESAPCPKCGADVEKWPPPANQDAEPLPKAKGFRWPFEFRPKREILATIGGAVLLVLAWAAVKEGCGKAPTGNLAGDNQVDVVCYPFNNNGWTFECEVTGIGTTTSDERFFSQIVRLAARQGNDLNRTFRGVRWRSQVTIERVGKGGQVIVGRDYTVYGTAVFLDGKRIRLTDCVFAPPIKED